LRVAFRVDARPFSYCAGLDEIRDDAAYGARMSECKTPVSGDDTRFRGFIAEICEFVIDELGDPVVRFGVDASDRFDGLATAEPDAATDILCDTTSVTPQRAGEHLFSPLVFVSGVSYAVSPSQKDAEEKAYIDSGQMGGGKTQSSSLMQCDADRSVAGAPVYRVGVLKGTTSIDTIAKQSTQAVFKLRPGEHVCLVEVDGGYADAVKQMCEDKRFSFFFGDRDMLKFYLDQYKAAETNGHCDVELSRQFYSFEPYAISVHPDRPDLFRRVQAKVFEFFTDPERVRSAFQTSFGENTTATPLLESLWRLNGLGRL
jgi:ABC-type amino acid transport substrate-binding protein